tara:strand:- start:339 stop:995 length:657 start_codon:yes stop_codon:yes gene_type:complete
MQYEKTIVKKPWGYEYLVYQNDKVALWFLYIGYNQQTSMHCHPNKTTGLILLDGEAEISFLGNSFKVNPISKTMIRKGLFHSTKAISKNGAYIFEIETPVDKHDLVRLEDRYGREGSPYEDSTFETPKKEECLWIDNLNSEYNFSNCNIKIENVVNIETLFNKTSNENVVFLDGGIETKNGQLVAQAGDVVEHGTLKKLLNLFPYFSKDTIIMTIKNE